MAESVKDLKSFVHEGDVLAACRAVLPNVQAVLEFHAESISPPFPGFASLILRVTATVRRKDLSTSEVKLIFKLPPIMAKQGELVAQAGLYQHEVDFFRYVVS
jgi:hypothetical protein